MELTVENLIKDTKGFITSWVDMNFSELSQNDKDFIIKSINEKIQKSDTYSYDNVSALAISNSAIPYESNNVIDVLTIYLKSCGPNSTEILIFHG